MNLTWIDLLAVALGALLGVLGMLALLLPKLRGAQAACSLADGQRDAAQTTLTEVRTQLQESQRERARLANVDKAHAGETALREARDAQLTQVNAQLERTSTDAAAAGRNLATARETIRTLEEQLAKSVTRTEELEQMVESLRAARDDAVLAKANAAKDLEAATSLHLQTKQFLESASEQMRVHFQAVSAQVLDQRGQVLGEQHVERLGAIVQPLSDHLRQLEEKIATVETSRAQDRGSMVTMIGNLAAAQNMLQTEASQLAKSLRGNSQVRGSWGEAILDKVLESSGLVEGRNYLKQQTTRDEDEGRSLRPDVVVELPDERSIVIDSKVSLEDYHRHVNAEDEVTAKQALVDLVGTMRARVKELSEKNYAKTYGPGGLDFVLMFVPIEGALALAVQERPELQAEALNKKVALVSPMTLHIALKTVEYLWRMDKLSRSMELIVKKGRLVYDEAVRMGEALLKVEKKLAETQEAFSGMKANLLDPSRGIIRRAQELHKLGVAGESKKVMPEQLALAVDGGDHLDEAESLAVVQGTPAPDDSGEPSKDVVSSLLQAASAPAAS